MKQLVLVGAGHAHLLPLREMRDFTQRGIRVTLIAPGRFWYSGMGPGMVSHFYEPTDDTVDVEKLVHAGGGTFRKDSVTAIDRAQRLLTLTDGSTIRYDALSLNVGSEVPLDAVPGAAQFGLPVKPIKNLLALRQQIAQATGPLRIVMLGGGAAGTEVAAHIARLLRQKGPPGSRVTLVSGDDELLTQAPPRARGILTRFLRRHGVHVLCGHRAARVEEGLVRLENAEPIPFDLLVSAIGIRAPAFLRASGLSCAQDGSFHVNEFLQSTAHPEIFGAGDCICFGSECLPRIGVFAVRQAPILHHNLRAFFTGARLQKFKPQKNYLLILNLGDGTGLLTRGPFSFRSRLAFWLKDWLDRRFIRRFQNTPAPA